MYDFQYLYHLYNLLFLVSIFCYLGFILFIYRYDPKLRPFQKLAIFNEKDLVIIFRDTYTN